MTRIVLIRHGDDPADDRVVTYFRARNLEPEILRPFKGDKLGDVGPDVAGSVVYGGPFNVFEEDRHPFLHDENRWIRQCIDRQVPLLGICQGAQSIARVLGAHVGPSPAGYHEFGYYELRAASSGQGIIPDGLHVAQSHFHEFQLPAGATLLAGTDMFRQQAFRYGETTYALQVHPEVTPQCFRRWQDTKWAAYGKPGTQSRDEQDRLMKLHDQAQHDWFMAFLDRLFGPSLAKQA
jgi:GMP synthase (glutamine-hydrolysing)